MNVMTNIKKGLVHSKISFQFLIAYLCQQQYLFGLFWQKFRESNDFTKLVVTKRLLTTRNTFSVRENFSFAKMYSNIS